MSRSIRLVASLAAASVATALSLAASSPAVAASTCDRFAAPSGSDSAAGTEAAPFQTVQKLADTLAPGQVGCLRGGDYSNPNSLKVSTASITLTSYPGERATIRARLWIAQGADNVVVENLTLNGSNAPACSSGSTCTILPTVTVNSNGVVFRNDTVTNDNTAICLNIGGSSYGRANGTVIESNRIHNCGRRPVTNHDHGIYLQAATGTIVRGNLIYDNADRGIQFYPDADQTVVTGNVIDGNGQGIIFSGSGDKTSSDNLVEGNLITNSNVRHNVESYYSDGTPIGTGNVVRHNCIHGGTRDDGDGGIQSPQKGFTATDNLLVDPLYVNRAAKDFSLKAASPCADLLAGAPLPDPIVAPAPAEETADEPVSEEPVVTLKPKKKSVKSGNRVALLGETSTETKSVVIQKKKRGGKWRKTARVKAGKNQNFRTRARVNGKRKTKFRAKTKAGAQSKTVRVKIRG